MGFIFVEICFANDVAAFHRPMFLDVGQRIQLFGCRELRSSRDTQSVGSPQRINVEALSLAYAAGKIFATVAERKNHRIIGKTWLNVDRTTDGAPVNGNFTDLGLLSTAQETTLFNSGDLELGPLGIDTKLLSQARADDDR